MEKKWWSLVVAMLVLSIFVYVAANTIDHKPSKLQGGIVIVAGGGDIPRDTAPAGSEEGFDESMVAEEEPSDDFPVPEEPMCWICESNGFVYNAQEGDPDEGIAPGTPWSEVPASYGSPREEYCVKGDPERGFETLDDCMGEGSECPWCPTDGWTYSVAEGYLDGGIAPGTQWSAVPDGFESPGVYCNKADFVAVECQKKEDGWCGNGVCDGNETVESCPEDCSLNVTCGNGVCDGNETVESCPEDCAHLSPSESSDDEGNEGDGKEGDGKEREEKEEEEQVEEENEGPVHYRLAASGECVTINGRGSSNCYPHGIDGEAEFFEEEEPRFSPDRPSSFFLELLMKMFAIP